MTFWPVSVECCCLFFFPLSSRHILWPVWLIPQWDIWSGKYSNCPNYQRNRLGVLTGLARSCVHAAVMSWFTQVTNTRSCEAGCLSPHFLSSAATSLSGSEVVPSHTVGPHSNSHCGRFLWLPTWRQTVYFLLHSSLCLSSLTTNCLPTSAHKKSLLCARYKWEI